MSDLTGFEVNEAIAKLSGLIISDHTVADGDLWVHTCDDIDSSVTLFEPITDNALNLSLRDEFEVSINYEMRLIWITGDDGHTLAMIKVNNKSDINRCICLCILESVK